jgi:predicted neuraminidase
MLKGYELVSKVDIGFAPPERPMCHGATIAELPDGRLIAAWYEGSYELDKRSAIVMSTSYSPGWSWTAPRVAAAMPGLAVGNPVLFVTPQGDVLLFFVIVYGRTWTSSKIAVRRIAQCELAPAGPGGDPQLSPVYSEDTWPRLICDHEGWMTRNKPIALGPDEWLLPVYDEALWCPMVLATRDAGRSWREYGDTTMYGVPIQPTLVELTDGRILMLTRTNRGRVWRSFSYNRGATWTVCQPIELPNPDSGLDAVRAGDGTLLLCMNDAERGRDRLVITESRDEGESWHQRTLVDESRGGEVSYPAIVAGSNGLIHVAYTWERVSIRHAVFRRRPDSSQN